MTIKLIKLILLNQNFKFILFFFFIHFSSFITVEGGLRAITLAYFLTVTFFSWFCAVKLQSLIKLIKFTDTVQILFSYSTYKKVTSRNPTDTFTQGPRSQVTILR